MTSVNCLQLEYNYISMSLSGTKPKTQIYDVFAKGNESLLGIIQWYAPWRQYCFFPSEECVFSKGCLNDINHFIEQLMQTRKQQVSLQENGKQ